MTYNIETQKEKLEGMLTSVTDELKLLGIHNPGVPEDWIATPAEAVTAEADANVAADRVEEWDERRANLSVLETQYNNIVRALKKIEAGTYGVCEVCDQPIEPERLAAEPTARTCIAHAGDTAQLSS
ncbi:MAG: TraR/DksA C4-type zinc finger protein [Candidatus Paceibacterota bacterium]